MKQRIYLLLLIGILGLALAACRAAPEAAPAATNTPVAAEEADEAEETEETEEAEEADEAKEAEEADEAASEETDGEEAAASGDAQTIRVGFMGPLTGGAAFIGTEQLGFVQSLAAIYSERLGVNIVVEQGDTEINPDTGRIVAERLAADESIVGVIGPAGSQVCEAVMPIFEEAGLAHITPSCTAIPLTQPGTATFFRPIPTDADQSKTIAAHMLDVLGVESAYLVDDQSTYSVGLNDEVETILSDAGITDIERASVPQDETDFSSIVTGIVSAGSDIVFFPSQIESQMATLAIQLQEQSFDGVYFLPDGGFGIGWVATAGEAAEGTFVTFFSPDPNLVPEAEEMNAGFTEITGNDEFGAFGGAAGFSAQILMEAITICLEADDVSRACVLQALPDTDLDSTVLGIPVSFGEGNQAEGSFSLFQVQDGSFVLLD